MHRLTCHELVLHYSSHLVATNLCSFCSASPDTCCIVPHLNKVCMQHRVAHVCFHCSCVSAVKSWIKYCRYSSAVTWTVMQSLHHYLWRSRIVTGPLCLYSDYMLLMMLCDWSAWQSAKLMCSDWCCGPVMPTAGPWYLMAWLYQKCCITWQHTVTFLCH